MKEDIRLLKNELRSKVKAFRSEMTADYKKSCDMAIAESFFESTSYKYSDDILTYVSTPIEVDTMLIIERSLRDGKRVACPRCIDGTRLMDFYYIDSPDDLHVRTFGVLEPEPNEEKLYCGAAHPICIVPGLSFDYSGYRLGYGKGYYDRFLSEYRGWTVGLCYSKCVERRLPHGRFDKSVDRLITEKYIRRCSVSTGSVKIRQKYR